MLFLIALLLTPPTAPLDVRADRLEYDQKSGRVQFEGNVQATQGDLRLTCGRLAARYRADGTLGDLKATGGVQVVQGELTAKARTATYFQADQRLELTGDPVVTRGSDQLRGAKITYWAKEQRLLVSQARGRLQAPVMRLPARLTP
jgi:lipopolysaccharide export system protein LptA